MKKMRLFLLAAGFLLIGTYINAQVFVVQNGDRQRGHNEFKWYIEKGIRTGELTDREIHKLGEEWEALQYVKRNAFRNGYISRREERRIWEAEQDFEKKLHVYMNNREREQHQKYARKYHKNKPDRYDRNERCDKYDRYERYDRH